MDTGAAIDLICNRIEKKHAVHIFAFIAATANGLDSLFSKAKIAGRVLSSIVTARNILNSGTPTRGASKAVSNWRTGDVLKCFCKQHLLAPAAEHEKRVESLTSTTIGT